MKTKRNPLAALEDQPQKGDNNRVIKFAGILVGVVVVTFLTNVILVGGSKPVNLAKSSKNDVGGLVLQSLASSSGNPTPPKVDSEMKLSDIKYFDNNSWAVATLELVSVKTDPAFVVMHKIDGVFRVVLGPSTFFSSAELETVPTDVVDYLVTTGVADKAGV